MDQLPRLGKRELICLLSFTCNYVVFVWRGFLFLWVLGIDYVILLWHSLSLPYNYSDMMVCSKNSTYGPKHEYFEHILNSEDSQNVLNIKFPFKRKACQVYEVTCHK